MKNQFDELTKGLAQSTTRRLALKKFGNGLAGIALAFLGLANKAEAKPQFQCVCSAVDYGCDPSHPVKLKHCLSYCGPRC